MQRQVPKKYTLIGDGRLARHLAHYFTLSQLNFNRWNRRDNSEQALVTVCQDSDTVLVLINDDQIDSFIQKHPFLKTKNVIHCSGALSTLHAVCCHPLMTFADSLYDLAYYRQIPFVCDDACDFESVFPGLPNPSHKLASDKRTLYHALLVMAGNFPQFLWQAVHREFQQSLQLPPTLLHPYLSQSLENFKNNPEKAVTGPFVRGDTNTIEKHFEALQSSDLETLYRCFHGWLLSLNKSPKGDEF